MTDALAHALKTIRADIPLDENDPDSAAQYGVKGMKWGVRRSRKSGAVKARTTSSMFDRESKLLEGVDGPANKMQRRSINATYRRAGSRIRQGIRAINKSEKYSGQDFTKDSPLRRSYYKDISSMMTEQLNASSKVKGIGARGLELHYEVDISKGNTAAVTIANRRSASDKKDARANAKASLDKLKGKGDEVKHAADSLREELELELDAKGYILDLAIPEEDSDLEHADSSGIIFATPLEGPDTVAQWGVKGMRWGFRKPGTRGSTPPSTRKKGDGDDRDNDDVPAVSRKTARQMSDQELRDSINRLRMEKEFRQLTTPERKKRVVREILLSSGAAIAKDVLTTAGKAYLNQAVSVGLNKALPPEYRVVKQEGKQEGKKDKKN